MHCENNSILPWYCLCTFPRQEQAAAKSAEALGREAFAPEIYRSALKPNRANRADRRIPGPLFPGYIFCRLDLGPDIERLKRRGPWIVQVRSLVRSHSGAAVEVEDGIIEEIRARLGAGGIARPGERFATKRRGDILEYAGGGAFDGVSVIFDEYLSGQDRVAILLNILGRHVRRVVEPWEVREPADI
jgi:transcription antitermination factor NusG